MKKRSIFTTVIVAVLLVTCAIVFAVNHNNTTVAAKQSETSGSDTKSTLMVDIAHQGQLSSGSEQPAGASASQTSLSNQTSTSNKTTTQQSPDLSSYLIPYDDSSAMPQFSSSSRYSDSSTSSCGTYADSSYYANCVDGTGSGVSSGSGCTYVYVAGSTKDHYACYHGSYPSCSPYKKVAPYNSTKDLYECY